MFNPGMIFATSPAKAAAFQGMVIEYMHGCDCAFLISTPTHGYFVSQTSQTLRRRLHSQRIVHINHFRAAKRCRTTISANSLEESKRRARSQYDNIPDLNQRYISELSRAERKYGPGRMKKDISKEVQTSILRPEGAVIRRPGSASKSSQTSSQPATGDKRNLDGYISVRNQLIGNTMFLGAMGLCGMWGIGSLKQVTSFGVGLLGSLAYVVLLSRSVDRLADGAKESGMQAGDALQPARVALIAILLIGAAKNGDKLEVLPVLFGFFTYKLATLVPLLTGEAFE